MVATQNQQTSQDHLTIENTQETVEQDHLKTLNLPTITFRSPLAITHHPKAGLNPLVDAAATIFSMLGKLKHLNHCHQLGKIQKEFMQEINTLQETAQSLGYQTEYVVVSRYILCATIDDIVSSTGWGGNDQWTNYSLLAFYNQDTQHQDKFFIILERALKEQKVYIDLMELMYLCLNLGYKGQYRSTEHDQYQLEQITNNLYKHIRAFRGSFSRMLSPKVTKTNPNNKPKSPSNFSVFFIFLITAYIIIIIFASLNYLTDIIANEAYQNISEIKNMVSNKPS